MKKGIAPVLYAFFLFISLIPLPGCIHRRHIDRQKLLINKSNDEKIATQKSGPPSITIWVHGTLMFYTPVYHRIFEGKSCLISINTLPQGHHFRVLAETIAQNDSEHFPIEEFYVFGWSGKLQNQERENAAKKLYQEIITLQEQYKKKYGINPIIRIIAHSHGGNVVLNMARLRPSAAPLTPRLQRTGKAMEDRQGFLLCQGYGGQVDGQAKIDAAPYFSIKSLILLACPVQEKTMHLICTPMFQRVYSLYSSFDIVQIIAPQFRRPREIYEYNPKHRKYHYKIIPFSARLFPIYSHLTQAKIKINDYPISHTRFSTKEFVSLLPTILQKLESWHDESIVTNKIAKHKLLCIYKKQQD